MAAVDIIQLLKSEGGEKFYPVTHKNAVIGLTDFFEAVPDNSGGISVRLRPEYTGLWADGWISAGGIGSNGGGQGGASFLSDLSDVDAANPSNGDLLVYDANHRDENDQLSPAWVNVPQSSIVPEIGFSDLTAHPTTLYGYGITDAYTKAQTDSAIADAVDGALDDVNVLIDVKTPNVLNGTVIFEWRNGDQVVVDLNHTHSDYVPITRTINGVDLGQNRTFYTLQTPISGTAGNGVLYGVDAISYNDSSVSANSDTSRIVWEPNLGAWHIKGNLYADGWIAAGGIGAGGGGGGGVILLNSSVEDVSVDTTTLDDGQILQWDGTNSVWKNVPLTVTANPATANALGGIMVGSVLGTTPTINTITDTPGKYYDVQCDSTGLAFVNVPWTPGSSGGSSVSIDNLLSSGTRIATLTIDGTNYDILAPTSGTPGSGETDPVFSASAAYGITSADITAWNAKVDASTLADYALKTGASNYNFLVNTLKFSIGTVAAQDYSISGMSKPRLKWTYSYEDTSQVGSPLVTETKYLAYRDEIPSTLKNPYALTFGSKTYDGSVAKTILASDLGAVTLSGNETITGSKTFNSAVVMGADIYPSTDLGASLGYGDHKFLNANIRNISTSYLYLKNLTTALHSGMFAATDDWMMIRTGTNVLVEGSYKQINFHPTYGFYPTMTGINLGYTGATNRWQNIYGVNGNLSGDLSLASTSHIDIGPLRIEYDSTNKALHITKVDSNDQNTYGIYADGFVSAGGVQQSS